MTREEHVGARSLCTRICRVAFSRCLAHTWLRPRGTARCKALGEGPSARLGPWKTTSSDPARGWHPARRRWRGLCQKRLVRSGVEAAPLTRPATPKLAAGR